MLRVGALAGGKVGFAALAMSEAAEVLLATMLQDRSLGEFIASRDPVSGSVYLAELLLFALMPAILGRKCGGDASTP